MHYKNNNNNNGDNNNAFIRLKLRYFYSSMHSSILFLLAFPPITFNQKP